MQNLFIVAKKSTVTLFVLALGTTSMKPALSQTFQEDFSQPDAFTISSSNYRWRSEPFSNDHTQFGTVPTVETEPGTGTTFARLPFSTYRSGNSNPNVPVSDWMVSGTEITSLPGFGLSGSSVAPSFNGVSYNSSNGWEFEARLRVPAGLDANNNALTDRRGLVFAFWTYKNQGTGGETTSTYSSEEIDAELLGNDYATPSYLHPATFQDFSKYQDPPGSGIKPRGGPANTWSTRIGANVTGFNWTTWQTIKIRWVKINNSPDYQVEWWVKDSAGNFQIVLSTRQAAPTRWMNIKFNNTNTVNIDRR